MVNKWREEVNETNQRELCVSNQYDVIEVQFILSFLFSRFSKTFQKYCVICILHATFSYVHAYDLIMRTHCTVSFLRFQFHSHTVSRFACLYSASYVMNINFNIIRIVMAHWILANNNRKMELACTTCSVYSRLFIFNSIIVL